MVYNGGMSVFSPSAPQVISVSRLNRLARDCLEAAFPLTWVGGEISNLTYAASGHVYFSLKDEGAQVRCTMWRSRAQTLGWRLENGQKVEVRALVSLYEARGDFQINVEAIRRAGQGDLFERFLRLKATLEAEGLFSPGIKRPLPAFPRRLAIVTSPQAAALRDVLTTLARRAPHIALTLYPTAVQGDGAGERIAAALAAASRDEHDLILLCRGGGSIEDLWAFNEEVVARAIRATTIPVVCGVGHETDFTIADFAADLRAPTPTAAAELASPDRSALLPHLGRLGRHLERQGERQLNDLQQHLDWLAGRLIHPAERLRRQGRDIELLGERLRHSQSRQADNRKHRLNLLGQRLLAVRPQPADRHRSLEALALRLGHALEKQRAGKETKLNMLSASLNQLDPHAVLNRGYALVTRGDGRAVRRSDEIAVGDELRLTFGQGGGKATVSEVVAPAEAL